MAVSKRLRYEVLRRDDYACRYCGAKAPDVPLTVDHVVPTALGGTDEASNLVACCRDCNAGKTSSSPDAPLVEGVRDDALRWAKAMQEAAALQRQQVEALNEYCTAFYEAWSGWYALPSDWRNTLTTWFEAGLEIETIYDCIDVALAARGVEWRWKYFCGVVWRRLNERQAIARDLLSEEERDES